MSFFRLSAQTALGAVLVASALGLVAGEENGGFRLHPASVRAGMDVGQIVHGLNEDTKEDYRWQVLRRTNIFLSQAASIGERAEVRVGQMGVFFYVLPEEDGAPHTRLQKFGLGPTLAEFSYRLGRPEPPWGRLQLGLFPYKYNPDASNLGEYLLRSGTYPGFLVTGGWNWINSASFQVQGAAFTANLLQGRLQTSLLLPMESVNPPMHSVSPTAIATWTPVKGFELGAGASCNHCIAARPSKETPAKYDSTLLPAYMQRPTSLILSVKHTPVPDPTPDDPGRMRDSVEVIRDSTQFYTFQGVKLMGRISVDPKALFGIGEGDGGMFGPADLRLFAEVALLGVKNYPFYYPERSRRMPVMFGMNLPTFRILDLLSLQGEYYNPVFPNNIDAVYEQQSPIPYHRNYDPAYGPESVASAVRRDRWHWSVLAKRQAFKGITFHLQAANDHIRTFDYNIKPIKIPITSRPTDWYYLFRIEVGV